MSKCKVCGSELFYIKKYNQHTRPSFKEYIKAILPHFNGYIPKKIFPKINAIVSNPFRGSVVICKNCGYGILQDIPSHDRIKKYYENLYWEGRIIANEFLDKEGYKTDPRAKHQIEFVNMNSWEIKKNNLSILEIGAGSANSSLLLRDIWKEKTIELFACEPGKQWTEHYKYHSINRIADFFPFQSQKTFDYIHTSHWLEHVSSLDDTVKNLYEKLNDNGYLFVEVPNCNSSYWELTLSDTPHIHFFTLKSLQTIFENNYFSCKNIEECGITNGEWAEKIKLTDDRFGKRSDGVWIRALFKKESKHSII